LIRFAKSPPKNTKPPVPPKTVVRYPIELEPGMVVLTKGPDGEIRETVIQNKPTNGPATPAGKIPVSMLGIRVGEKEIRPIRVDSQLKTDVLVGPDGKTPLKRPIVTPSVATPKKPKPAPKKPIFNKQRINQLKRQFKDDGKDIAPAAKSPEAMREKSIQNRIDEETGELLYVADKKGKPRTINSPNAIVDAIFEENPNAKINADDGIVIERSTFTDTDGTQYRYEVVIERTKGNQFMERYVFSDPKTKEVLFDFYNHDYKDSFAAFYGKGNGVVVTRDFFLGRTVPGKKGVDASGVPRDTELRSYFGPNKTIKNRIKFLEKKYGAGRVPRIISPEKNATRFTDGHERLLNMSDTRTGKDGQNSTLATVARGFVADIYEAIETRDLALIQEAYKQALGRLPDNDKSSKLLLDTIKAGITERFKGTKDYAAYVQIPNQLAALFVQSDLDIRDLAQIPFVSQDGVTPVKIGSYVQFFNNEDGISVGRVTRLIDGSGKNGNYKDTVAIQFADQVVPNLQTRNMQIIPEDDLDLTVFDNDDLLTNYIGQLQGEEMVRVRLGNPPPPPAGNSGATPPPPPPPAAKALPKPKITYADSANRETDSADSEPDDILDSGDAGSPYLGSDGTDGTDGASETETSTLVENLDAGDSIYDPEDGSLLGEVLVVELVSRDPDEYDITYESPEGEEFLITLKAGELNGPK
jgi:hypothetical protein